VGAEADLVAHMLAARLEDGVIRVNPAAGVRVLKPRPQFLVLLLEVGLRVGEIIDLRWRDVDVEAGTVRIRRGFYRGRVGHHLAAFALQRYVHLLARGSAARASSLRPSIALVDRARIDERHRGRAAWPVLTSGSFGHV
jgi:integrase